MTATTPRGAQRSVVALARDLQQRRPRVELDRPARVVLEEVDRLADVGVGLAPRLGALAHGQRGELEAALAQPRRGAHQRRGALGRRARAPLAEARAGARSTRASTSAAVAPAAWPRRRSGSAGSVESSPSPSRALVADPHRHAQRQPRLEPGHALDRARARTGDRRSSRTGSLANGGRSVTARQQLLDRRAGACVGEERLVAACSRAGGGPGRPCRRPARRPGSRRARGGRGGERVRELVAEAAQDLQLEVAVVASGQAVVGDRVGDRAQVVGGDGDAHAGVASISARGKRLEVAVPVRLVLEHRHAPAVLARLDHLVVPVGALDQAHRERLRARASRVAQARTRRAASGDSRR